ncbi:YciI family protein [Georgenia ruanii]|uniref:YCII-related domain-containing protein n=1 Tax=Georgenia ruanii TaxID=348442 RepID=A0A7J9UUL7_9MICO|nr:YciI family protein [Georgenia ruanii]MPV88033.1 hypothetical protein [Georgenia ruanii]
MPVFALTYTYTNDTAGRDAYRPKHKELLGGLAEKGILRASGPFGPEETPGALLLVRADSKEEALTLTQQDPFRVNGFVSSVTAQEWIPMTGPLADEF